MNWPPRKNRYSHMGAILIALLCIPCITQARDFIREITLENATPNLAKGETSRLSYLLSEPCSMTLFLVDIHGNIVRNLLTDKQQESGKQSIIWNGRDNNSRLLPDGAYFPILRGKSEEKGLQVYNPTAKPWGEEIPTNRPQWNKTQQSVEIHLDERALCRMRVFIPGGGPLYRKLSGWQLLQPGVHQIPWDGKDADKLFQVTDQPDHRVELYGFSLPEHTIVLKESPALPGTPDETLPKYPIHPPHGENVAFLINLTNGLAPEPEITFEIKKMKNKRVSSTIAIHVALKEGLNPAQELREDFELYLFVNGQMDSEIPQAQLPQTIEFDTTKYANGEHVITVNILSAEERAATQSQRIVIAN